MPRYNRDWLKTRASVAPWASWHRGEALHTNVDTEHGQEPELCTKRSTIVSARSAAMCKRILLAETAPQCKIHKTLTLATA